MAFGEFMRKAGRAAKDLVRDAVDRNEAQHQVNIVMMFTEEGGREQLQELRGRLTANEWRQVLFVLDQIATEIQTKYLPKGRKAARLYEYASKL